MKTSVVILIIFAGIVAIGGTIFVVNLRSNIAQENTLIEERNAATIRVTPIRSQVFTRAKDAPNDSFFEIKDPSLVKEGSHVKTSQDGRALIEDQHATILDHDTEMVIAAADAAHSTRLELAAGNLWSRVEKVLGQGEFFEIKTQNAVAAVHGTSFGVRFRDNTTVLLVGEGVVSFTARNPKTGDLLKDTTVFVEARKKAMIKGAGAITIQNITNDDRNSEWFHFIEAKGLLMGSLGSPMPSPTSSASPVRPSPSQSSSTPSPTFSPTLTPTPSPTPSASNTPFRLYSINPLAVYAGDKETMLEVTGSGFSRIESLFIGDLQIRGFTLVNDGTIRFRFPPDLSAGKYGVFVIDKEKHVVGLEARFTVKESSPTPTPTSTPTPTPTPTRIPTPIPTPTPTPTETYYPQ